MTRQEAIERLELVLVNCSSNIWDEGYTCKECGMNCDEAIDMAIEALNERPKGKWIFKTVFPNDKSEFPMGYLVCPICGSHHRNSTPCNYCDNCGADMRGDEE